jgi:hypothetical protein
MNLDKNDISIVSEKIFYKMIIDIPIIHGSMIKLLDDKYIDVVLDDDLLPSMRSMYLPIIEKHKEYITLKDDNYHITNNKESRNFFAKNLNKEVRTNMSIIKYCIINYLLFSP